MEAFEVDSLTPVLLLSVTDASIPSPIVVTPSNKFNSEAVEVIVVPPTLKSPAMLRLLLTDTSVDVKEIVPLIPLEIVSPFQNVMSLPVTVRSPKVETLEPVRVIAAADDE